VTIPSTGRYHVGRLRTRIQKEEMRDHGGSVPLFADDAGEGDKSDALGVVAMGAHDAIAATAEEVHNLVQSQLRLTMPHKLHKANQRYSPLESIMLADREPKCRRKRCDPVRALP
jgi:hypothetical protein